MIYNKEDLPVDLKEKINAEIPSKGIAAFVVLYKVLGIQKEFAIFCMEELARRRSLGEDFDFETYIEEKVNLMPKQEIIDIKSITGLIKSNFSHFGK